MDNPKIINKKEKTEIGKCTSPRDLITWHLKQTWQSESLNTEETPDDDTTKIRQNIYNKLISFLKINPITPVETVLTDTQNMRSYIDEIKTRIKDQNFISLLEKHHKDTIYTEQLLIGLHISNKETFLKLLSCKEFSTIELSIALNIVMKYENWIDQLQSIFDIYLEVNKSPSKSKIATTYLDSIDLEEKYNEHIKWKQWIEFIKSVFEIWEFASKNNSSYNKLVMWLNIKYIFEEYVNSKKWLLKLKAANEMWDATYSINAINKKVDLARNQINIEDILNDHTDWHTEEELPLVVLWIWNAIKWSKELQNRFIKYCEEKNISFNEEEADHLDDHTIWKLILLASRETIKDLE